MTRRRMAMGLVGATTEKICFSEGVFGIWGIVSAGNVGVVWVVFLRGKGLVRARETGGALRLEFWHRVSFFLRLGALSASASRRRRRQDQLGLDCRRTAWCRGEKTIKTERGLRTGWKPPNIRHYITSTRRLGPFDHHFCSGHLWHPPAFAIGKPSLRSWAFPAWIVHRRMLVAHFNGLQHRLGFGGKEAARTWALPLGLASRGLESRWYRSCLSWAWERGVQVTGMGD